MTADLVADVAVSNASLRRYLHGLPGVDQVGAEGRAAMLSTRSIKAASKERAIDLAISMVDLTTLEGMDTPGKVRALCAKALRPDPTDPSTPHVAAVCVYGDMAAIARHAVGDALHVAAVATAFPSGRASLAVKLADTRDAVANGADEIDMVIDRGAFLAGRYLDVDAGLDVPRGLSVNEYTVAPGRSGVARPSSQSSCPARKYGDSGCPLCPPGMWKMASASRPGDTARRSEAPSEGP